MTNGQPYTLKGLDEYLRDAAPAQRERGEAWLTAIGLQQVDGLQPSPYLLQTALSHIAGDISMAEAKQQIESYYRSAERRDAQSANNDAQSANNDAQSANTASLLSLKCKNCTLEEVALLRVIIGNNTATQKDIALEIGKSERTVKSITVRLQAAGILKRVDGRRYGHWELCP